MPTPIREQVLAAFHTAIDTALTATVERNRSRDVPVDPTQFVVINDGPQYVSSDTFGAKQITMTATCELWQRASTSSAAATALNGLYADVVTAALADPTLGNLAQDVRESDMPNVYIDPEASKPTVTATVNFEIVYQVKPLDPYTKGP